MAAPPESPLSDRSPFMHRASAERRSDATDRTPLARLNPCHLWGYTRPVLYTKRSEARGLLVQRPRARPEPLELRPAPLRLLLGAHRRLRPQPSTSPCKSLMDTWRAPSRRNIRASCWVSTAPPHPYNSALQHLRSHFCLGTQSRDHAARTVSSPRGPLRSRRQQRSILQIGARSTRRPTIW